MYTYWDSKFVLAAKPKNLIAVDREGNWEGHFQAFQNLLPIFVSLKALITNDMGQCIWK